MKLSTNHLASLYYKFWFPDLKNVNHIGWGQGIVMKSSKFIKHYINTNYYCSPGKRCERLDILK